MKTAYIGLLAPLLLIIAAGSPRAAAGQQGGAPLSDAVIKAHAAAADLVNRVLRIAPMRLFAGSSPAMRRTTFSRSTAKATRSRCRGNNGVSIASATQLLSEELLPVRHIVVWRPTQAARPSTRSSEKSEDSLPAQVGASISTTARSPIPPRGGTGTAGSERSTSWPSTASTCRWPLPGWKPSGIPAVTVQV